MNLFNRIVVSLLLVAFIMAVLVIALLPQPVIESLRFALNVADYNLNTPAHLLGAVLGLVAAVGAFALLIAELRPSKRKAVVVAHVAGGTAELTSDSVAMRVKRVAESIPNVREATPVISSHGKTVSILLKLSADPDIDLPRKTEEVMQAVRSETESKMGIPIKRLRVTVTHTSGESRFSRPAPGGSPKPSL